MFRFIFPLEITFHLKFLIIFYCINKRKVYNIPSKFFKKNYSLRRDKKIVFLTKIFRPIFSFYSCFLRILKNNSTIFIFMRRMILMF